MSVWQDALLHGYIREIGEDINKSRSVIIPVGVIELCILFYKGKANIMLLLKNTNKQIGLFIADIAGNTKWNTNIHELNKRKNGKKKGKKKKKLNKRIQFNNNGSTPYGQFDFNQESICYKQNFTAPKKLHSKIKSAYSKLNDDYFNDSHDQYHAIFKNKKGSQCNAFIFHSKQLQKRSDQS